jgi:Zn-finger nucleic acid-binding protein
MKCPDCKVEMVKIDDYQDTVYKCPKCFIEIGDDDE